MESMLHPPRTALELFKILPEGTRCQLIDGHIIMSPSPVLTHQKAVIIITTAIKNHLDIYKSGEVYSDVDIYINETNVYRPDIFYISNEQMHIIGEDDYVHGAPDLVIEVLSKGTAQYDKTKKKAICEQYGVKECWMVNPKTKQCTGYTNENNVFKPLPLSQNIFYIQLLDLTINL